MMYRYRNCINTTICKVSIMENSALALLLMVLNPNAFLYPL